jgi:D-alanyl-D-alanine carboxypeptidase
MNNANRIGLVRPNLMCLFISLFLAGFANGQSIDPALSMRLQDTLDSIRLDKNIQGISAAVFVHGQGLWTGVSGESYPGVPISPDMTFGIGSNTKTFTAVMLMKLVEHNLVSLDDSLFEWLPSYNPNIDSNITIRQMLNHASGIANTFDVPGFLDSLSNDRSRILTTPEVLSWLPAAIYAPGTGQNYSNPNYHLTGLIIEQATGQNLEQLMRDSIFGPLGMGRTFFPIYDSVQNPVANPWHYNVDWNDTIRTSLLTSQWSAGAMYSTAGDMAYWYNELMNNQFLNPDEFDEMITFTGPQDRGLGIQQLELNGRTVWGHGGGTFGYISIAAFDTLSKSSVVVLINASPSEPKVVAGALLSTLAGFPVGSQPIDNSSGTLIIYPNPADNKLWLDIESKGLKEVRIYNLQGQLLLSDSSPEVSLESLESGLYIIEVETREKCYTQTFMKY